MNHDPLEKLLRHADEQSVATPADVAGLADKVWRKSRRNRRRRLLAAGGMIVVVGVVSAGLVSRLLDRNRAVLPRVVVVDHSPKPMAPDLAQLQQQIAVEEKKVDRMLAEEKLAQAEARLAAPVPDPNADPIERAAASVVRQGDHLLDAGLRDQASASYGQVVEFFPQSAAAQTARQRLVSLETKG